MVRRLCYFGDSSSIHLVRWSNLAHQNGWEVHLVSDCSPVDGYNEGVVHHRLRSPIPNRLGLPWVRRLSTFASLLRVIKKIDPDVIHAHSIPGYGDYMGMVSKFLSKTPIIVTAWGFSHIEMEKSKSIRHRLSKMALDSADVVTVSVPEMRELLVNTYGLPREKLVTFTWGVDLGIFRSASREDRLSLREMEEIPPESAVFLSPRTMRPHYRIDTIIRAASQIIRENPNVLLVVLAGYGRGSYSKSLRELVSSLKVEDNVRMIPHLLSPQEMSNFYNIADFIIQVPLKDQLSATLLESMACGAIPILSDIGVYRERFTEGANVLYTENENSSGLSETMLKALSLSRSERNEIVQRNKNMVEEEEDFRKKGRKMIRIYEELALRS